MKPPSGALAALIALAASSAQAVEPPPPVPVLDVVRSNLEQSYTAPFPLVVAWKGPTIDPLWFEANLAPHFLVGRNNWPIAVDLTPKIVLRMYRENSTPIKTPSYMPRVTAYLLFSKELAGRPVLYSSFTFGHHSNGQSGGTFLADGTVNHDTGDFATNYLEAALYVADGVTSSWWVSPSLEWHPRVGTSEGLAGRYGFWRAHLAFAGFRGLLLDDKLSVRVSGILDHVEIEGDSAAVRVLRRVPVSVRYLVRFPTLGVGGYLSVYAGPDYYNVWFDRYVSVFQIGLAGDTSPRLPGVF